MTTFEELGVSQPLRKAVEELGFEYPMPVQERVIPRLLGDANDIIALAQTGTGKTAAFGLPLLQRIDPATSELTLTNNLARFLDKDVYSMIESYLRPSLTYSWNGKKFTAR